MAQIQPYGAAPLHVELTARGTVPPSAAGLADNAIAAALLASPVAATFSGDVAGESAQGDVEVEAGPLAVPGELRSVGPSSYLSAGGSWYRLGSGFGPSTLTQLPVRVKDVVSQPEIVGSEEIDGIATQHVEARVDPARALELVRSATGTTFELANVSVRSASTDLYIDGSHRVRRLELRVDGKATDGKSVQADITLTTTPGSAFTVSAPQGARPLADLPGALVGGLGGSGTTSTPSLLPAAP